MENELLKILESTNKNEIDAETALVQILDLIYNDNIKDCNCCYFTTGEHANTCPKHSNP